jgi:hypothetical protein
LSIYSPDIPKKPGNSVINRAYGSFSDLPSQNLDKTGAYAMIS